MPPTFPPGAAAEARRAYQGESPERTLIDSNLPLVKHVVDRMRIYLPAVLDQEDLYSVGVTGLIAAAQKFDPAKGTPFSAYATLLIRGAVHDELRRMDCMPRGVREKAKKVHAQLSQLEQRLGRPATEAESGAELGLSAAVYSALLEEIKPVTFLPLDGFSDEDDSDQVALHDLLADDAQPPANEALEKKELANLLVGQLRQMPEMPKKVLALYYFENMRLAEIAAVFGVTEGRISQIHTQAVQSLRAFLKRTLAQSSLAPCC